jgi:hypothetical protein
MYHGGHQSNDLNDFNFKTFVEVVGQNGGPVFDPAFTDQKPEVVPLPPAVWMSFGLLAGIGIARWNRRRRISMVT